MSQTHKVLFQVWNAVCRAEASLSAQQMLKHMRNPGKVCWFPSGDTWLKSARGGWIGHSCCFSPHNRLKSHLWAAEFLRAHPKARVRFLLNFWELTPKQGWQGCCCNAADYSQSPQPPFPICKGKIYVGFRFVESLQSPVSGMVLAWRWMWKCCSITWRNKLLWVLGESKWRADAGKLEMLDATHSRAKISPTGLRHLFLNYCICFLSLPVILICFERRLQIRRKSLVNWLDDLLHPLSLSSHTGLKAVWGIAAQLLFGKELGEDSRGGDGNNPSHWLHGF